MTLKEENREKRWEEGVEHHPMSIALMEHIQRVDLDNGGMLDWKYGGDGDNGEALMYEMDSWFENFFAEKMREVMQTSLLQGIEMAKEMEEEMRKLVKTNPKATKDDVGKIATDITHRVLQDLFKKYGL